MPASDLETIVEDRIRALLRDEATVADAAGPGGQTVEARKSLIERSAELSQRWPALPPADKRAILHALVARIDVRAETVDITVSLHALPGVVDVDRAMPPRSAASDGPTKILSVPARVRRTGSATKLMIQGTPGPSSRDPDRSLLRLIGQARRFHNLIISGEVATVAGLADRVGISRSYFARVFRLSFLAPQITKAILEGRQPPELTANKLMLAGRLAPAWPAQRRQLGLE